MYIGLKDPSLKYVHSYIAVSTAQRYSRRDYVDCFNHIILLRFGTEPGNSFSTDDLDPSTAPICVTSLPYFNAIG